MAEKLTDAEAIAKFGPEFRFLDDLRESGETNMFGARPYLMDEFEELTRIEANAIVGHWMETFTQRHPSD